jgi:2-polyprenyl-3-methyl-5-hydroxy-6-metoxy-1,4-benzoquinol methylase
MELYKKKEGHYFSNVRRDLISLLPSGKIERLLELGAGSGDTLVEIKQSGRANEVVGIELMKLPGTNQDNKLIDRLIFGDFETLQDQLELSSFDVIICGDVLEHLINPWSVLDKLKTFLRPGGTIIVSCPNIRYYQAFINIFIKGTFPYTDHGLFDRTHLRFFCKSDLKQMILDNGFKIQQVLPSFKFYKSSKVYLLNLLSLGLFEQILALQYIIKASKEK